MRLWSALAAAFAVTLAASAAHADESLGAAANASGRYFGAAIDVDALSEKPYRTLVESQLTSATAENAMKWGEIETARGVFDWGPADAFVAFAKSRGQKIRGHNLVWHQQLPRWLIGGQFSASDVKALMLAHIETEVARYKGSIYAWDVINEPFADTGEWRHSIYFDAMGRDYVALALRAAHEADPDAKLYINDYGVETAGPKTEALFNLVAALKREGVPLDGVGFQCHFVAGSAPDDLADVMGRFATLGVDVAVTELDLRIPLPVTSGALERQADDYASVVAACVSTPRCVGVTTWGVTDDRSWIPGFFSGYGAALPFDEQYRPKPAVSAMTKAFTAQRR
ncbi:MAG: endo-1,4-beta-xylanase [Bradyrhizobium sp.]|nr:MAG: endo-1,4-beta-xylanase [Bradyrhizobium sp.]